MPEAPIPLRALALEEVLDRVCRRVAPVWPLRDFVAVNPFLGLADEDFAAAAARLRRVAGRDMLPPREWFRAALAEGRITAADLAAAGADPRLADAPRPRPAAAPSAATVADVLDATLGTDFVRLVTDEIGKWAASWADEGQAAWPMPWRHLPFYAAWRAAIRFDRAPRAMGLKGFRAAIAALPEDPTASIAACLSCIGLRPATAEDYLHRALLSVAGWSALLRQRGWSAELAGESDDGVRNLLAVRLAWDAVLFALHEEAAFRSAWEARLNAPPAAEADLTGDVALLAAAETAFRRHLARRIAASPPAAPAAAPEVQAAFCIDVRSEVLRRALEAADPGVETIGFAGFFGFAVEHVRFGDAAGVAQCPVLLRPAALVCEALPGATPAEAEAAVERVTLGRRVADLWSAFRASAVSCFAYVEAAGLAALAGLARGVMRRPRSARASPFAPDIAPREWRGRQAGLAPEARIAMAEAMLRGMSLTEGFGGLVLLVGHGAQVTNNPHAAGLDCGACGGHSGEVNARIAAAVLNDPRVREGLAARGIRIPAETWFLAGLHETVTDEVRIFDADRVPLSQRERLVRLQRALADAAARTRAERALRLGLPPGADVAADLRRRGADWSEVRPEWALANNAAFIAAPRWRTLGADLGGRVFLHSYDWRQDRGFAVLELIMTAPMVVANWINLQYYGSTVDNEAWGAGNKVLHNVVGLTGVLEGQGGDLRTGLPMQSVHDGTRFVHEPLRLSVLIEAPEAEMDRILARHGAVRALVENGWLHLIAIRGDGTLARRVAAGDWRSEDQGPRGRLAA